MDLNFGVRAHRAELFLQIRYALNVMLLELGLVRHYIVKRTNEVLLKLVIEGLPRDLNADPKHDMNVNDLLFQSCV